MRSTPTVAALLLASLVTAACRIGYEEIDVHGQPGEAGAGGSDIGGAGADSGGTSGNASGGNSGASGASTTGGSTSGGATGGTSSKGGAAGKAGSTSSGGSSASGGSTSSGGSSGKGGASGSGSGGTSGCSPTNGSVEVCDGLDNDCSNGADDAVTCPSGCTGVPFEGNGYQFCETASDWPTARANCETQGMHLVKVDSDAENTFIGMTLFGTATAFAWLGGDDLATAGTWRWQDGSLFWTGASSGMAPSGVYTNWYPGLPGGGGNTHCLEIRDDYTWDDKQCTQGKRYVCELLYP